MLRAHRFQLRLKGAQEAQLRRFSGMARWVWNRALAEQRNRHERGEKYAGPAEMCRWLTAWRQNPETAWLAEGPVHTQQQVLRRLDAAFQRFFANVKAGRKPGFPRFKRRGEEPGLRFPDPEQFALDAPNARVRLPKIGWARLRLSRAVTGELRNASIAREGDRWFCALQVRLPDVAPAADLAPTLGIDLGVAAFASTSDGQIVAPLQALKRQQARLRRHQRSVSRKGLGSRNRGKAVSRLGALHRRIARQRADWLHKLTSDLASRHPVIAIEDLQVAAMSASARGTVERPGKRVRQKAGLNRSILDAAWGEFRRQLDYKLQAAGGRVIAVNPAYTSRTCRVCSHESADNRRTQALFACVSCGHREHADIHAAKNILAAGHAAWTEEISGPVPGSPPSAACGGAVRRRPARKRPVGAAPMKQEPTAGVSCA